MTTHTHTHTILGGVYPGISETVAREEGFQCLPYHSCDLGVGASFLHEKQRLETPSLEQTPLGEQRGALSLAQRGQTPGEKLECEGAREADLGRMTGFCTLVGQPNSSL